MIRIENLCKTYEDIRVLVKFSLLVPTGFFSVVMVLNGAGKTTVIKHLAGFVAQDSGIVAIDGQPVIDNEKLKGRVLIIPDEVFFFRGYSLKDMRGYYKDIYQRWNDERFERMTEDFKIWGISQKECVNRPPSVLLCRLCRII